MVFRSPDINILKNIEGEDVVSYPMPKTVKQLLPREAYISDEWFEEESQHLFSNTWAFAGVTTDVPNPGDYITLKVGKYPLIVVRDKNGELNAFHNICRHRGTELLEGKGCAGKTIVCPYHRWTFNLDGRLRGIPNMKECFPTLERKDHNLFPASLGVFKNMMFVHPKENPIESFENWLGDFNEQSWPHDISQMHESETLTYEMKCNWKVFYENAIDGYHLAYLHDKTLGPTLTPDKQVWDSHGRHVVWYSTEREGVKNPLPKLIEDMSDKYRLKPVKGLDAGDYPGVVMLFPTTIIGPNPFGISISELIPITPDITHLKVRSWSAKQGSSLFRRMAGNPPGFDKETGLIKSENWKKHPLDTLDFQTEDVWVCEKMQRSLHSPSYQVGPLAQGAGAEAPLTHFQQQILDLMPSV